jgi:hypothetical protein
MTLKQRIIIGVVLMALAGSAGAYFTSLDAPQDFPVNI